MTLNKFFCSSEARFAIYLVTFRKLWLTKTKMSDGGARGFTYLFISLWKIGLFLLCMSLMVPLANILPNWYSLYTDFGFSFHYNDWYLYYTDNAGIDREVYIIDELNRWEKLWKSPGGL